MERPGQPFRTQEQLVEGAWEKYNNNTGGSFLFFYRELLLGDYVHNTNDRVLHSISHVGTQHKP